MINNYKILTLTFSDAHLENLAGYLVRGDDSDTNQNHLMELKKDLGVQELYYLQTCNRVMYLIYSNVMLDELQERLRLFFQSRYGQYPDIPLSQYSGESAIRHVFEVISSLKSMIVGEQEILRQAREAYENSNRLGLSGDQIRILFQSALQTAKSIHHQTRISEKGVSVVSLAMKKLRRLGIHKEDNVILIGAGETMRKVAKFLKEWGVYKVKVFNRSVENLQLINQVLPKAQTYFLDNIEAHDLNADFIITSTGHDDYILTPELVNQSTSGKGLPNTRAVLDLAIPRDVHPSVVTEYGLKVIEVESLRTVAGKNMAFRKKEVEKALVIVEEQVQDFKEKVHRRFIERAFQDIPRQVYATRDRAINEVFHSQIQNLDVESQNLIEEMMEYMARKCISIPMKTARQQYTALRKEFYQNKSDSDSRP